MSIIQVNNLTFRYEGNIHYVFENVSFHMDTNWKLGLIGRNGKGKTTLFKLLLGKYPYKGSIHSTVDFDYFPFEVKNPEIIVRDLIQLIAPNTEEWEILREFRVIKHIFRYS